MRGHLEEGKVLWLIQSNNPCWRGNPQERSASWGKNG